MTSINIKRHRANPLIQPSDVKPSRADFKVEGVFNCGAVKYKNEVLLICRVAESAISDHANIIRIPLIHSNNGRDELKIISLDKGNNSQYDFSDSRVVFFKDEKVRRVAYLTSLSHLRIARSTDGVNFTISDTALINPRARDEAWGMEDARVTQIGSTFYISYSAVSPQGVATSLLSTKDFKKITRHGIIFAPENKDVTIFPKKIRGKFVAFNRPVPTAIGNPDIWYATSPNLLHWGEQEHFYGVSGDSWENGRIGGGAVPFLTKYGWLKIYHAADNDNRYCLGAFLLDKNDPRVILGKTKFPLLEPTESYEKIGFFGNVVFTCGALLEGDTVRIYYGAADDKICLAETTVDEIYASLELVQH